MHRQQPILLLRFPAGKGFFSRGCVGVRGAVSVLFLIFAGCLDLGAAAVDFNREVRPVLSRTCFQCHGADESSRKAKLRLDLSEEAFREHKGTTPIVPGKPDQSEAWRRILSKDPEEMMPPPGSKLSLTKAEIASLGKWIRQGASYDRHWAFEPLRLPGISKPPRGAVIRNPIDSFVTAKLGQHGLRQNPEASRHTLIRRVFLDLTGLPPSRAEVADFVADKSPLAYEHLVDHLLASPHYGEKWARLWLDVARYADSSGYGSDQLRLNMWPYRDWIIDAFNANMPYDQFTIEQLAGDLLPGATIGQRLATAFHRNTMTNTEGGTDPEEYRVAAVKDRVNTTMQAWMGLTAGCAQCHTHKFDPITQREYYQLFAIFNQTEDFNRSDETPLLPVPSLADVRKERLQKEVAALIAKRQLNTPEFEKELSDWSIRAARSVSWQSLQFLSGSSRKGPMGVDADGVVHARTNLSSSDKLTVQFKTPLRGITALRIESLPAKGWKGRAKISGFEVSTRRVDDHPVPSRFIRVVGTAGQFISLAEVQVFSGSTNLARQGRASQSSTGFGGEAARAIDGNTSGDYENNSVTHTAEGDAKPFWEVDLGLEQPIDKVVLWNRTGGVEQRLVGATLEVLDAARKTVFSRKITESPRPSEEVVLSGPSRVELKTATSDELLTTHGPENAIDANKSTLWEVALDAPHAAVLEPVQPLTGGEESIISITLAQSDAEMHPLSRFRVTATAELGLPGELPEPIRATLALPAGGRTEAQSVQLADFFRTRSKAYDLANQEIKRKEVELAGIRPFEVPVMVERTNEFRVAHVLSKGNYLSPAAEVRPALLGSFHPGPTNEVNRLALARWLVAPENPLTPRVAVNRFWAQLFGLGIVETEEDFGTQGAQPFNQPLLDWLAVTFKTPKAEGGLAWDMKALIKLMVCSQTYRQSSLPSASAASRDPRNQFVSHYPRRRLEAEAVRDQALALAGLLSPRLHGASAYPPQPDGLWVIAFRGAENYPTSKGEDRWRRSLYTVWRRNSPNPTMTAFDAPSREVCTMRRLPTNTPLQSFVTLNDPVFVEAAQAFARRILNEATGGNRDKIRWALETTLSRPATKTQIDALSALLEKSRAELGSHPERARQLASGVELPLPPGKDPVEFAAWTALANVLLNLDALLVKS